MYRNVPLRGMGQDLTDELSTLAAPSATLGGLSPIMATGLGLLAVAFFASWTGKGVRKVRRAVRKRAQKRQRIDALKSKLKQLGA